MKLLKRILLIISVLFLVLTCSDDNAPEKFILSVTITPEEGGSVSPDGGAFDDGTVITLTATPSEGYVFKEWMGDLKSTENPVSASMDTDMNITLVFVKADGDEDGIPDDVDDCLNTPPGEEVDENGCSSSQIDTDGDGVSDDNDLCSDTPEGEEVNDDGCSTSQIDTDGDGITDDKDICPNTPEGEDVNEQGCPTTSPIYLDENGVTIKAYEWAEVGQTGVIAGTDVVDAVVYTIVDETMLREMIENGTDVSRVCTTKVTNMSDLFSLQFSINDMSIRSWDVSNVTDMSNLFALTDFNQPIGVWDVSSVENMSGMFGGGGDMFFTHPFNQDISAWDVGNVTDMSYMFYFSGFNQPIGDWDVSSVTEMSHMFAHSIFNQDIGSWDVGNVTDMSGMFNGSTWSMTHPHPFNQNISDWDVANVTDMSEMFLYSQFNQPIGNWDVSSATYMSSMFALSSFNQPIGDWDVSNVSDMRLMFYDSVFNQDLGGWDVQNVVACNDFSTLTPLWVLPKPNFTNCDPDAPIW